MGFFKNDIANIKAFVFDVDGVLAKGTILISETGDLLRTTHTKDGFSLQLAVKQGFSVAIITGGNSKSVKKRYENLGIKHVYINSKNKISDLEDFMQKENICAEEILYMGDDIPDFEVMQKVGIPTCPKDAVPQIKAISKYISEHNGGEGCVRDVIEQTLRAQEKWAYQDMKNIVNK